MKEGLREGLSHEFKFTVTDAKTVPSIYPESGEFQEMPKVFATGFMVALLEWACIDAIKPYLDWPAEQTVGTHINVSHEAATPPGMAVTVSVRLVKVDKRRLVFDVVAHDEQDKIAEGTHERFVIDAAKFNERLQQKISAA